MSENTEKLKKLKDYAEANGGQLLSTEYTNGKALYHFVFADGRDFWRKANDMRNRGWPKDPDFYFRSTANPYRGKIFLEDMREIAEENEGRLLSTEWLSGEDEYRFMYKDGREFSIRLDALRLNGWPKDLDFFFRMSSRNPGKGDLHLKDMRKIAELNNGKLLSLEWLGNNENYHFEFEDGREFWTTKHYIVQNGWPKDPDAFLRKSSNNPNRGDLLIGDMKRIAEEISESLVLKPHFPCSCEEIVQIPATV